MPSASAPSPHLAGELELRPPAVQDESQGRLAQAECLQDAFDFLLMRSDETWADWLSRIAREHAGTDLPEGRVPATMLFAFVGDDLVGRVSIRHELNAFLLEVGGHIGYAVRPAFRRRGYATEILRQSLETAGGLGIEQVLVTCDVDNVGSRRTIERCGGVLEDIRPGQPGQAPKRRYWITIA